MRIAGSCSWLLLCAVAVDAAALPYCSFSARVDGDPGEWREPLLHARIDEPAGTPAQRNQTIIRSCWDLDALRLAITVDDADPVRAPSALDVDSYHQYDSLQVYIDPRGDAGLRMNDDDVDLLLLPDGRLGVLRGDSMIGAIASASVPQRVAAPLAADYATRQTATGWTLELRVPWAGLGIQATSGVRIGMDIASNDWLLDHPPGDSGALTPERVRALSERAPDAPEPDTAVGTQLLPRTWSGDDDFGYPARWRPLKLAGGPGPLERLQRAFGTRALAWIGAGGLALGLLCTILVHSWHRRRLRELLARLAAVAPVPAAEPVTPVADELPTHAAAPPTAVADAPTDGTNAVDPRDREFAERVLAHVRQRLAEPLGPADLAQQFHVSLRTLQRRLKSGLDTSPQDLVLAARLEAARGLLRDGRLRVGEVAARVGFEDLSHFSRRYRQAFGHPPSEEGTPRD